MAIQPEGGPVLLFRVSNFDSTKKLSLHVQLQASRAQLLYTSALRARLAWHAEEFHFHLSPQRQLAGVSSKWHGVWVSRSTATIEKNLCLGPTRHGACHYRFPSPSNERLFDRFI